ncbi:hypothetical protein CERSUDRAFT_120870 [Gelatoporia subvermispora B]|uniref:PUA domain-containing protein n=1 Tax=Ceriporiopsis subvermispora (strain B) TaxID=914234 RepID=M2RSV7_CERS8|nr:hypothetical protein CERSUDRAFT_120870 [Gelatoporia subvermispora B]
MRPLTEEESKAVFTKLANYVGKNLVHLIDRPDEPYCFRLHKDRVFYVSESSMRLGISVARPNLISLGTCFGKFSKSGKFKLHITALDYLAQYAKYKVWIKPNGEMPFLYGNHVLKAHLGRITEDTPEHQGVVVYSMNDVPLGFGVTARSTVDTRKLDPTAIIVFHQADVGEYLRDEHCTQSGAFEVVPVSVSLGTDTKSRPALLHVMPLNARMHVSNSSMASAATSTSSEDLCTQWTRLTDVEVTVDVVGRLLKPIQDDLWVAAACLDRTLEDAVTQRSLLDLGVERTQPALIRSKSTYESPGEPTGEASDDAELETGSDPQGTQTEERRRRASLLSYFAEEPADAQLCHIRAILLDRLDRLNTFVEICNEAPTTVDGTEDPLVEDEWEDDPWGEGADNTAAKSTTSPPGEPPIPLSTFMTADLLHLACTLASLEQAAALHILTRRHGSQLWPYRLSILDSVPEYALPSTFRELLPAYDPALDMETKPKPEPWRAELDFSESASLKDVLVESHIIQPSALQAQGALRFEAYPESLTGGELSNWYQGKADLLASSIGMVDAALALVQHAASQGIPGLDELGEELSLFARLVYDATREPEVADDWTLARWKAMEPPDVVRAYLAQSTPVTVAKDIVKFVMPYLFVLESRAERAGRPDPALPHRYLHDYILEAPLNIVAAIFEASKPTLPPAQRLLKNDEDMVRLALACLYGSDRLDAWPTMSRIFECLPAWEAPSEDEDEADEAETTIASLGAFVTPSTTRPRCTPSDLLLFFKPLPLSALSHALDVLDVHLESGEILARWSVPAPLRWFLQSNSNIAEQRSWANRMARRAGGAEEKLDTQDDWEWLLEDMMKLSGSGENGSRSAFCLLSRDDVVRIFFSGLLSTGRFDIAKVMLRSTTIDWSLDSNVIEDICLQCSQEFYENAASGNYHFGDMKLAYECLDIPGPSPRLTQEKEFIEATSRLCSFNLTSRDGTPITPLEIRLTKDRLSLLSRVLSSNQDAYKHTQVILELVHKLGFREDIVAEVKTLAMLVETALQAEDFQRAFETCERMVQTVLDLRANNLRRDVDDTGVQEAGEVCWVVCFQLARHPEFDDVQKKLMLMGRALELCPADKLHDVLPAWHRLEEDDLEERRGRLSTRRGGVSRNLRYALAYCPTPAAAHA